MKNVIIYFVIFLFPILSIGQKTNDSIPKRNTIYFEGLGQGMYYSFSYDRIFRIHKKIKTSISIGGTSARYDYEGRSSEIAMPISFNFLFGNKNSHLELGLGFTLMKEKSFNGFFLPLSTNYYSYFSPKIGYRFQRTKGGVFFRATFCPMIAFINQFEIVIPGQQPYVVHEYFKEVFESGNTMMPWFGISVGYTFWK